MALFPSLGWIYDRLSSHGADPEWWYRRVLVTHILGRVTRYRYRGLEYKNAISVMDEDWDNLFVLDACRADYFEDVADINRFDDYRQVISQGSHFSEWTRRNFQGKKLGDTVYVTGNLHTKLIAEDCFHDIVEIRDGYDNPDTHPNASPEDVADAAREIHEQYPNKRMIVHFMQPHSPLYDEPIEPSPGLSSEEWWHAYRDSVEEVLTVALKLHDDVDGKSAITADHGETHNHRLFSLFSINSHPPQLRIPELVKVPWAVVDGERRTVVGGEINRREPGENVEEGLRDLGYLPPT